MHQYVLNDGETVTERKNTNNNWQQYIEYIHGINIKDNIKDKSSLTKSSARVISTHIGKNNN